MNRAEARSSLYGFEVREVDNRRTERDSRGSYNVKTLWQNSHEIIGLALQGHSQVDIATTLGVSTATVSNILNSELGQEKLSAMRKKRDGEFIDVSKRINELAEKAMKVYEEIFDSDTVSYTLKKSAADTITMDLGGHRSPTKIDTRSTHLTASLEELEEFKRLGHKAAEESGLIIDIKENQNELEKVTE